MERREALKIAAATLVGGGLTTSPRSDAARQRSSRPASFPFLQTGDQTKLFYRDWGQGAPAVVFVHGWPLHSDMWQYQMLHLASNGVRAISYDQRGCGRSADPGTGHDFDTLADDLASVIEQLEPGSGS
jgi:non-heme chloroperoxidase